MDEAATKRPVKPKTAWAFMAEHMPQVVAMLKEHRAKGEGAHVDLCWQRGVRDLVPGWFWAYEGGVAVGVPDLEMLGDANLQQLLQQRPGVCILKLADPARAAHGA